MKMMMIKTKKQTTMKKVFYIAAIATLSFLSCQREEQDLSKNDVVSEGFTFKASIEQFATRGDINDNNKLVWAEGDKIGIYVNDASWDDHNQPFTLTSNGGSTEGVFAWDYGTFKNPNAAAAFFPWSGTGLNENNVSDGDGIAYFKLKDDYWSYSSGKMLTPLVAPLSGSTDDIHFKHAGAAVKVTINNLPKRVRDIGMSVEGQQITGDYHIDPAQAGTACLTLDEGAADATKNSVWLHVWNGSESKFTFIFPVPAITKPKLSFQIWDENGILVWSKKLKAQSSDLNRNDILVMPPLSITPYSQFTESDTWTFCGTINGSAWVNDIPMYTDGNYCILRGITFKAGDEFKIRKDKKWVNEGGEEYPSSNQVISSAYAGERDIWFNTNSHEIEIKEAKCPYPSPKVTLYFGINSVGGTGIALSSSALAHGYEWPGLTLTEREYINGKWYYKHVVDGGVVWGKTISGIHIVGIDSWNTAESSADFTTIKTEYYFEATSGATLTQLNERPEEVVVEPVSITIDGNMSDWDDVEGVTYGNHTVKVVSDNTKLYFYSLRAVQGRYSAIWGGGGYIYLGLDLDNDSTTGDGVIGSNGPYEFVCLFYPYAGTSDAPAFNESPQSNWDCSPAPYSIANFALKGVADATDGAAIEFSIPRADLPTIPNTPITIKFFGGSKDLNSVSLTRVL